MDIQNEILQLRWAMLTNPFALPVPPLCEHIEIEVIDHLMLVEALNESTQYTREQMKKYRARFKRFCTTQWIRRGWIPTDRN